MSNLSERLKDGDHAVDLCAAADSAIDTLSSAVKRLEMEKEHFIQEQETLLKDIEALMRRENMAYGQGYIKGKKVATAEKEVNT